MLEHYRSLVDGSRSIACRIDSQRDEQVWLGLAWQPGLQRPSRRSIAASTTKMALRARSIRCATPPQCSRSATALVRVDAGGCE